MLRSIKFENFKALKDYSVALKEINVLVGPNNAGKSTVLEGLRALEGAIRFARRTLPRPITGPGRHIVKGFQIPTSSLSIGLTNLRSDYNESDTSITCAFENGNKLTLLFKAAGSCVLYLDEKDTNTQNTRDFAKNFPAIIATIPTLGPFEEEEKYLQDEYVARWRKSRRAHRMFRNIWIRQKNEFPEFRNFVEETWPGMSIHAPEIDYKTQNIDMFCREGRIDREIYWAGFGFQVWLQFLTHLLSAEKSASIVIDEPDIYLHPDLQHRLFSLLKSRGKQIILATHSVEIINEAEHDEVVLIDKTRRSARRINDVEGLQQVLYSIGSAQNIHLARLSKGRKVLFLEGKDVKLLKRFAAKLGFQEFASDINITVIEIGGFSQWQKVQTAEWTFRKILETDIKIAALFDRDYRCDEEIADFVSKMRESVPDCFVLERKEIENYLLDPDAICMAMRERYKERGTSKTPAECSPELVLKLLDDLTNPMKASVLAQLSANRVRFFSGGKKDPATIVRESFAWLDRRWSSVSDRLKMLPGKEVLSVLNKCLQETGKITLSPVLIARHIKPENIGEDLKIAVAALERLAAAKPV